jgi:hypothetical protein
VHGAEKESAEVDEVIVVENYVDSQCIRHLHLMSNFFINRPSASLERGVLKQVAGVWHYCAEYPYRGVLDVKAACAGGKFRRLVVWSLSGCGSVREAICQAEGHFWAMFRFRPAYVFIKRLPDEVENGLEFDGLVLLEAEWMLDRCVAVGGRQ